MCLLYAELFPSDVKGPIPGVGSDIFRGITFMLTYVDTAVDLSKPKVHCDVLDTSANESSVMEGTVKFIALTSAVKGFSLIPK